MKRARYVNEKVKKRKGKKKKGKEEQKYVMK